MTPLPSALFGGLVIFVLSAYYFTGFTLFVWGPVGWPRWLLRIWLAGDKGPPPPMVRGRMSSRRWFLAVVSLLVALIGQVVFAWVLIDHPGSVGIAASVVFAAELVAFAIWALLLVASSVRRSQP